MLTGVTRSRDPSDPSDLSRRFVTDDRRTMSETVVIINPASGPGGGGIEERTRYRTTLARQTLERLRIPHRIELTRERDHAAALARAAVAAKSPLVFAWGGDGTMNEIG